MARATDIVMLRKMYRQMLALAGTSRAEPALALVSFAESSFFPLPPDVMLAPMCLARPERAWRYAALCAASSVAGAVLGYSIGFFLGETLGRWILTSFGLMAKFEQFRAVSAQLAPWVILGQGLLPVPYKLVTIACGMLKIPLLLLVGCSIITRTTRFFAVAYLFKTYGPSLAPVIEKRIGMVAAGLAALIVVGVVVVAQIH
jgi:membrane protein YqaA with SNARE-associated domain